MVTGRLNVVLADPRVAKLIVVAYILYLAFVRYSFRTSPGTRFAFPDVLCAAVGMPPYPACALPTAVFVAINIPAIWIAGLACGLLGQRHPFVGLGVYAIHFANSLSHLGVALASGTYNPGTVTAALIQLPLSLWVAYSCFGRERTRPYGVAVIVLAGTLLHVVLLGSVNLFAKGFLSAPTLVVIQVLNPLFVVLVPWLFEEGVLKQVRPGTRSDA